MSNLRRMLMAQGGGLVPFCDAYGVQVVTTLSDGTMLNVNQKIKDAVSGNVNYFLKNNISCTLSDGIFTCESNGGSNSTLSCAITTIDGHIYIYIRYPLKIIPLQIIT